MVTIFFYDSLWSLLIFEFFGVVIFYFQPVVGSVILIKHRRMMELFPSNLRRQWMEWELRVMILFSLFTQIFLILLGNRRKHSTRIWLRITVWSSYLLADSIATMASSILSNNLGEAYKGDHLDPKNELKAFWAPLFLLHLGGTDTVTAYSLEDNELWKRHLFGLVSQAMTIFYVMLLAWTNSHLSFLFIVMFLVGLVKYLERVWVLYSASENKFRDSIPDIPTNESKIVEDCKLKELKGYHLTKHQVLEVEAPDHSANTSSNESVPDANEIVTAYKFLEMVKRLFADLILGIQERDVSRAIFEHDDTNHEKTLKIIEIELGIIYDLLYTKANVVYSSMGIARRIIGFFSILVVFVMLTWFEVLVRDKQHHCCSEIDLIITFALLAVALLLELCAFSQLLLSDHTIHWLINHKRNTILRAIKRWAPKKRRWSHSVAHLSLLSLSLRKTQLPCRRILKMFGIDEFLEIHFAMTTESLDKVDIEWKICVEMRAVRRWAEQNEYSTELKSLFGRRGGRTLKKFNHPDLEWSIKLEFDQSILIWHLATDILYNLDYQAEPDRNRLDTFKHARSMYLSRYMLYLLVQHPYMLPIGMAHIRFQDIYVSLKDFIDKQMSKPVKEIDDPKEAAQILIEVNTEDRSSFPGEDKSSSVIFHACKLAKALKNTEGDKWEMITYIWIEMLGHAASLCKGRHHAQQLRLGGELLTHVWLLMAHYGLTDHFQIPRSRAIADVIPW